MSVAVQRFMLTRLMRTPMANDCFRSASVRPTYLSVRKCCILSKFYILAKCSWQIPLRYLINFIMLE